MVDRKVSKIKGNEDGRKRDSGDCFEGEGLHQEASDLKCSAAVIDVLSDKVRELCDAAIKSAKADARKTLLEKDF